MELAFGWIKENKIDFTVKDIDNGAEFLKKGKRMAARVIAGCSKEAPSECKPKDEGLGSKS